MQKNKNRTGLALGAIVALVSSLFVMTAPAQASESSIVIFPSTGLTTQTTMLADEAFDISARFGTGVAAEYKDYVTDTNTHADFGLHITKPAGVTISATTSGAASGNVYTASATAETAAASWTVGINSSGSPKISIGLNDRTSVSPAVAITVTPFLDLDKDGVKDNGEPEGTAMTINFVPWSALGSVVSMTQPVAGGFGATASWSVTKGVVNWTQLNGQFAISISHTAETHTSAAGGTDSAAITIALLTAATGASASSTAQGNYSVSFTTGTVEYTTSGVIHSLSASVMYSGGGGTNGNLGVANIIASSPVYTVTPLDVSAVTISPVAGSNITQTGAGAADARLNSAFSLNAYGYSLSSAVRAPVATAFTVSAVSAGLDFDADSGVILNGTTYTSRGTFLGAGFTLASGTTTVAVSTFGQDGEGTVTFNITSQYKSATMLLTIKGTVQTVNYAPANVAGLAGAAKTFTMTAYDQWGLASVRSDQRIAASVLVSGSTSTTVSAAVANGVASVTVTPPAAKTGSGVVTFTLQTFNQSTQAWDNVSGGTDTATWNIYTYASGTDGFTTNTVSISSSISYGVALSWSGTVTIGVVNSFSDVLVSAPGLMIRNADAVSVTASDTLTIAANTKLLNVQFTSRLAGSYTVTFTTGAASTTSLVVIQAAAGSAGSTLTFDKTSIAAGTTTTIVGTLKDVNGNPVQTADTTDGAAAAVSVAWTGKGLPFGNSTTMETDAAGQLTFYVLVLSGEVGDAAISATYKPAGATVSTKNITVVQAVAVGKAAATAAADQKVNVGSFKGYVALYAKGYAGQKMTAIVAGKWIKVDALASNFERVVRYTGAGYTITTKIYIDGVLTGTFSTVTK